MPPAANRGLLPPTLRPALKRDRLPALLTGLFLLLAGFVMFHHELWRDEVQGWLLARDSASLPALVAAMRYEGHPALWQLLLLPLTRAFASPVAMQVLHLLLAATTVYLFVRWSPFSRGQKALFCFGYFPFYEYGVISRNYGLCLLLLTVFGCLYPHRHRRFLSLAACLALLCHAHALGLLLALALLAALGVERLVRPGASGPEPGTPRPAFYGGCALVLVAALLAFWQLNPPADASSGGWSGDRANLGTFQATQALAGGYLPVPTPAQDFWNRPLVFDDRFGLPQRSLRVAVVLYAGFVALALRRHLPALLFFGTANAALLAFFHLRFAGAARHHGFFFLVLMVAIWMHRSAQRESGGDGRTAPPAWWDRLLNPSLTLLLALHGAGTLVSATQEIRHPFSRAPAVATYLRRHGHQTSLLVGYRDYMASSVLAGTTQQRIYYPQARRWGSYIRWNRQRLNRVEDAELIAAARALPREPGQGLVLILNRALDANSPLPGGLTLLAAYHGSVSGENFYLYQIEEETGPAGAARD